MTTLVSNTGQSAQEDKTRKAISQRFSTGSNEDGYTLTGVDVVSASSTGFTAQVCGVDSDLKPTSNKTALAQDGSQPVQRPTHRHATPNEPVRIIPAYQENRLRKNVRNNGEFLPE